MEDIKIKISNTEAANIEIVPTETGVEIIIHKNAKTNFKPQQNTRTFATGITPNSKSAVTQEGIAEMLKNFCSAKKTEHQEKEWLDTLKKFYNFYNERISTWKFCNNQVLEQRWEKWIQNEKSLQNLDLSEKSPF